MPAPAEPAPEPEAPSAPAPAPTGRLPLKARLSNLLEEYGKIALFTYLGLSLATITAFSIAIGIGFQPSTSSGVFGVIAAGWLAAKATMPLRILATLGLTPLIGMLVRRRRPPATPATPDQSG